MNDGGAHVIVPVRPVVRMLVLLESNRVGFTPQPDLRRKSMRFWDFFHRLQTVAAHGEGEKLARAVGADRLDRGRLSYQSRASFSAQSKERRRAILEYIEGDGSVVRRDMLRPVDMIVVVVTMTGPMSMMVAAGTEQPRA